MTQTEAALVRQRPAVSWTWLAPTLVIGTLVIAGLAAGPDPSVLAGIPAVILVHLGAALAAFGLGVVMLASRKGRTFHRRAGWLWVGLMTLVAGSSLFITEINGDAWSWIHILSGSTLVTLPFAVWAARKHKVGSHRGMMIGLFTGGMLIAGGFTFLPGRLMWQLFFG